MENIRSPNRRAKLMREISIIQVLDIVKLIEVIKTERYIGMVLEYASGEYLAHSFSKFHKWPKSPHTHLSGGELFEHILACRFSAQLITGVHYLHTVHRDLKLEDLLLDG
ncbi:hypothetical protein HDV00_000723 [Rhizophlyctis rosea]|nr:hypothetical protein HDV00_000723 [Rhizophlyctis rosea]